MQIDLSVYPEDNHYSIETHMTKGGVETTQDLAYLFQQFAAAIGFTYVESVVFYDREGEEVGSSNDLMDITFSDNASCGC